MSNKLQVGDVVGWLHIRSMVKDSSYRTYYTCECGCSKEFKVRSDAITKFVMGRTNSDICFKCFQGYRELPSSKFKWVPNTRYAVSENGEVWSSKRDKFLKVTTDSYGFGVVHLGKSIGLTKLHRIMAEIFVPNPQKLPYVGFKDGNPSNLAVSNLEWYSNMEQLSGFRFGKLTVTDDFTRSIGKYGNSVILWDCICDCGGTISVLSSGLLGGDVKSCGCLKGEVLRERNFTHGLANTPEYRVWLGMRNRCNNPKGLAAKHYHERGIIVEEPWNSSFTAFLGDMGKRPTALHTIERVDVNKNYCKENCIWTDNGSLQAYNQTKRSTNTSGRTGVSFYKGRWIAYIGEKYLLSSYNFEEAVAARESAELELYGFNKE